ncbi:hypothetical protein FLAG1_06432 [Fusarium langsethiae]|uniref:C2H2-type domain-containing protein n=1 Tax=Fusarium langsethiae TaxID=179993 RepID=A0A0M9EVM4_FUSLA|nr:hypothetical protein FLAG1_06432 [Fusarium langsethiae]GKU03901.1 unnamed protein product [Fusarium langsethiae]GKU19343.1 unnamed protein product [Fusarium langsethiae]
MESSATAWELDSDEIASITSEDLHTHRPNRWTGPKSTWRTLTEEDRLLWQSMKQIQDQDLAVHLYDAFALKRQGQNEATAQNLVVKTESGQDGVWAPPKLWTAWPLKHKHVHKQRLVDEQHDEDDRFTFRRQEEILPSTELEEEISATILRTAKRRFRRKKSKMAKPSIEDSLPHSIESGGSTPNVLSRESSAKPDTEEGDKKMALDDDEAKPTRRRNPKTYEPVESTNDEASYALLRPSTRHILSKLDDTLVILQNSREAGMNYVSDSSTEEESDNHSQSGQKKSRGRPRKITPEGASSASASPARDGKTSRRGRPRKAHVPRDGETCEEMAERVARESHRKIPITAEDRDAAFDEWVRKGDEIIERERSLSIKRARSQGTETGDNSASGTNAERKRARLGLRDWSDVLGAAALAGFSGDVIARTARRCADLFGEGMVVRTLNEVPATKDKGTTSIEYRPEPIQLSYSDSDADDESDDGADLVQRRVLSRQASLAHSSRSPDSIRSGSRRSTRSPAPPSAARSRSGSTGGLVFCPIPSCDRAANGFSRKTNLRRHMELVHQGQTEELDSDEEVVGGVHVDGFLKPIVPGRGWRGEDTTKRQRKMKEYWGERSGISREASYAEEGLPF